MMEMQNSLVNQPPQLDHPVIDLPRCGEETVKFVVTYLTFLRDTEQLLSESFIATAQRHRATVDAHDLCLYLARYSQSSVAQLTPFMRQYTRSLQGKLPAEGVRGGLLDGGHLKELTLLLDLQDTALLVNQAKLGWIVLHQIALALKDQKLQQAASQGLDQTKQQLHWLESYIKLVVLRTALMPHPQAVA
ncbi:hypothetical protein TFLX_02739 [Thermoflexales bacterium]|nr:hypothetical protein TFLX_02739 [Thermoflexales bacterium]